MEKTCKFPGCYKTGRLKRGYCHGHYKQLTRYNFDETKLKPLQVFRNYAEGQLCTFVDQGTGLKCDHRVAYNNLCNAHNLQLIRANGDMSKLKSLDQTARKIVKGKCKFPGCENLEHVRGYCSTHYAQFINAGRDETKLKPIKDIRDKTPYYKAVMKNYPGLTIEVIQGKWKILGIRSISNPYNAGARVNVYVTYRDGSCRKQFLSRHLMELKLERNLRRDEHVDHIKEGYPKDDHIDNLQVLSSIDNFEKYRKEKRKRDWDDLRFHNTCTVCGKDFQSYATDVKSHWRRGAAGLTCSSPCRYTFISMRHAKVSRDVVFQRNRKGLANRLCYGISTDEDQKTIDRKRIDINKLMKARNSEIERAFQQEKGRHDEQLEHLQKQSNGPLIRDDRHVFMTETLFKSYGREDWKEFYTTFFTYVHRRKMTRKQIYRFLFFYLHDCDLARKTEMAFSIYRNL